MNQIRIGREGAVHCHAALELPLAAISVWGQIRDFQRFARQDFFHATVEVESGAPRPGAPLRLGHRFAWFTARRAGRILWWREGEGYSFSDLSLAGPGRGFPHVFSYRIAPRGNHACRLHISVRGRWTARHCPRWIASLWLRWVFSHLVTSVENELLLYRAWRATATS